MTDSRDRTQHFTLEPFAYAEAAALARELDLAGPVAIALVRRGLRTVSDARAFLSADESHDPAAFNGMDAAVGTIRSAIARGERITVHGDYDVDGVTSTAILVAALRELGADCDWMIPDRVGDGYGVTMETVTKLEERGTQLVVTVDCGITSVAEIEEGARRGIAAVVTDHHQPGDELPDCPIVHPIVGEYPCPDLCAAAVAHKLVAALIGAERAERDLDLVGLATIADMVPLRGENRSLARRGIAAARRARRPGLRALMQVAGVTPERVDEGDFSFRLAPRINAAGRLYRADAGVELFLTSDEARAKEIAGDLDRANHERRATERDVLADAQRRFAEDPDANDVPGLVVWGEDWHAGVVGICASRMAERHGRPAVLIALDAKGRGKGSGRSVPGFDLLAALRACGEHLARFGGHRAAAGLEIEPENLDAFRDAFVAYTAQHLNLGAAASTPSVDVVVGGECLDHELATQLARLGPFGVGNPPIRLLVPSAQIEDVHGIGAEERHSRFALRSGGRRASGVAFGINGSLASLAEDGPLDVSLRLELNEWNGAVSAQVVLEDTHPIGPPASRDWSCPPDEQAERVAAELQRTPTAPTGEKLPQEVGNQPLDAGGALALAARTRVERGPGSAVAAIASLVSSGAPVLAVCADALWRRPLIERLIPPGRFAVGGNAVLACRGSLDAGQDAVEALLAAGDGGLVQADWYALESAPLLPARFEHVVVLDPAPSLRLEALVAAGQGFLHLLAESADAALTLRAAELQCPTRDALASVYRGLREAGAGSLAERGTVLCGDAGTGRSPEAGARTLRVLGEIGVVQVSDSCGEQTVEPVSSKGGDLGTSSSFRAYSAALEETKRFLTPPEQATRQNLSAAA